LKYYSKTHCWTQLDWFWKASFIKIINKNYADFSKVKQPKTHNQTSYDPNHFTIKCYIIELIIHFVFWIASWPVDRFVWFFLPLLNPERPNHDSAKMRKLRHLAHLRVVLVQKPLRTENESFGLSFVKCLLFNSLEFLQQIT